MYTIKESVVFNHGDHMVTCEYKEIGNVKYKHKVALIADLHNAKYTEGVGFNEEKSNDRIRHAPRGDKNLSSDIRNEKKTVIRGCGVCYRAASADA